MTISANTLFHFTKDRETLLSILKTKFYPKLCLEKNFFTIQSVGKLAVPMVCFCDIPLSQISDHVDHYGAYAIGLKKQWAIKKGITPILYTHNGSLITKNVGQRIKECSDEMIGAAEKKKTFLHKLQNGFIYQSFFMKPYEGQQIINGKEEQIVFYNEREWRYVPPMENGILPTYLVEKDFSDDKTRQQKDKGNERFGLDFDPADINYIIVGGEDDVLDLKRQITEIKDKYPSREVELLTTRIISIDRIREDF